MRFLTPFLVVVGLGFVVWYGNATSFQFVYSAPQSKDFAASTFFVSSVTAGGLKARYEKARAGGPRFPVLVVPGHDDESWGAEYKGLKEADVTLKIGTALAADLAKDPALAVTLVRDENGYNPIFEQYLKANIEKIKSFVHDQRMEVSRLIVDKEFVPVQSPDHSVVGDTVANRLYGINSFANDNGIPLVIHIHLNDYGGRARNARGEFSGFAIYVPEKQYSNAAASAEVAESVESALSTFYAKSDQKQESVGIVPDQDLIAIGANNTLDGAGILIEYAYIYEPAVQSKNIRPLLTADLAHQTYRGIESFFGKDVGEASSLLPHHFSASLRSGVTGSPDIFALQAAFVKEGFYPPLGETFNSCPLSGIFLDCTARALASFQTKYGISGETGILGRATLAKLNELFAAGAASVPAP